MIDLRLGLRHLISCLGAGQRLPIALGEYANSLDVFADHTEKYSGRAGMPNILIAQLDSYSGPPCLQFMRTVLPYRFVCVGQ